MQNVTMYVDIGLCCRDSDSLLLHGYFAGFVARSLNNYILSLIPHHFCGKDWPAIKFTPLIFRHHPSLSPSSGQLCMYSGSSKRFLVFKNRRRVYKKMCNNVSEDDTFLGHSLWPAGCHACHARESEFDLNPETMHAFDFSRCEDYYGTANSRRKGKQSEERRLSEFGSL